MYNDFYSACITQHYWDSMATLWNNVWHRLLDYYYQLWKSCGWSHNYFTILHVIKHLKAIISSYFCSHWSVHLSGLLYFFLWFTPFVHILQWISSMNHLIKSLYQFVTLVVRYEDFTTFLLYRRFIFNLKLYFTFKVIYCANVFFLWIMG